MKDLFALVIDDEPPVRSLVGHILSSDGWTVVEAESGERALELMREREWVLVVCDVVLGGVDGYEVLRRFVAEQPAASVVLMTGHGSAAGALDATAIGAYDYLTKPFEVEDILRLSAAIRALHQSRATDGAARIAAPGYVSEIGLIGKSAAFIECLKLVGRVAATNLPVLITGESGTGKEVVARAIHRRSKRAAQPFVAVNCGAIPTDLIESELFGHARGAFTGADRERRGLWEEADGGTIFLDEITETNAAFQVKLLRVLQQNEIRRVGSNQTLRVDARVIAATNRDIEREVGENRFRQDLMYRLNAVNIHLPPLRERVADIPQLCEHFAAAFRPADVQPVAFSAEAMRMLQNYDWRGNVRELENAVLHAASLCDSVIYPEHLPARVRSESAAQNEKFDLQREKNGEWLTLAEMEAEYVRRVLAHTGGNKQAAARLLDIDRKTLARIAARRED